MHAVAEWFATVTQGKIPGELAVMLISMVPLLELRGGMIVAKLLEVDYWKAVLFCVIGNIIPIPFILLFIKKILNWMAGTKHFHKIADWVFGHAKKRSGRLEKSEFMGLLLFIK